MSNTYGGWNPQDPQRPQRQRPQDPQPQMPQPQPQTPQPQTPQPQTPPRAAQPFDPYGPRDPYGRPANPYGRPDYQPRQQPEQRDPQPGVWGQLQGHPQEPQAPLQPAVGYPQQHQVPPVRPELPRYSAVSGAEHRYDTNEPPTVGSAWRWGWSAFGASWGLWVMMSLLLGLAQIAVVLAFSPSTMASLANATDPAALDAAQAAGQTFTAKGLAAAGTAVCFLLQALLYSGALAATRTRKVRFRDFFALHGFGGLLGYAVITGALSFVSISVPVVGWLVQIIFTLLLLPVPFLILKGVGFGKAIAGGIGLVLSHIGTALAVFAIFAGLSVASILTCGLGLVVVAPAMLLVGAYLVQRWTGDLVQG